MGTDQATVEGETDPLVVHMATIPEVIRDTKDSLEMQIAAVVNEVGLLHEDHKKLSNRIEEQRTNLPPPC
ncbi:hypothetical protein NDU88_008175 [Pleurodeles waltl]|uniref:Uncharacterized protein n=1 Tax=Pleurodeles waltl TaxID=8319 RepID=A0AAV7PP07_PLEWA|nr:hypothetical protein NDU88_008175 [Pleurodeles waltl]